MNYIPLFVVVVVDMLFHLEVKVNVTLWVTAARNLWTSLSLISKTSRSLDVRKVSL